jgi:hypothetical protein
MVRKKLASHPAFAPVYLHIPNTAKLASKKISRLRNTE